MPRSYPSEVRRQVIELAHAGTNVSTGSTYDEGHAELHVPRRRRRRRARGRAPGGRGPHVRCVRNRDGRDVFEVPAGQLRVREHVVSHSG
jgi:hypothetical protein